LHADKKSAAAQLALQVENVSTGYKQLLEAEKLLSWANDELQDSATAASLKTKLHQYFPYAVAFMNESELQTRAEAVQKAFDKGIDQQETQEKN
jgi:capsular polysaccharide biosynthesis protein